MSLFLIAAVSRDGAIGITRDGERGLPWPTLRHDQRWFSLITRAKHALLMATHLVTYPETVAIAESSHSDALRLIGTNACLAGWRTAATLPHPLPGRTVIPLRDRTSHDAGEWGCHARSMPEAFEKAEALQAPHVFVIGGARPYTEALQHPALEALFLTEVDATFPKADTWFPTMYAYDFDAGHLCFLWEGQPALHGWHRTAHSPWIQEPERPRYRFGIWTRTP